MFKKGEIVVYSATGVCRIEDLCEKQFGSFSAQYYVLKPLMQKCATVFVPVNNAALTSKIHAILTKSELEKAINAAQIDDVPSAETEYERRQRFSDILQSGDRTQLVLMVWELYRLKKRQMDNSRRLHLADERLLDSAENILFEEIAYVYGIEKNEAEAMIDELLKV